METSNNQTGKKLQIKTIITLSVVTVFFLLLFYPTYGHLKARFDAPDSYYSHGVLIPFLSAWLIWRKRRQLAALPLRPAASGIFVILSGVLLHLVGVALKINFLSYTAIIIVLSGIVLYLLGKTFFKHLFFPLAFLFFMMPLPEVVIIGISFRMKMIAAGVATWTSNAIGIAAVQSGSTIYLHNGYLIIGDPCSGLRSLISFFALGALFTQITDAHYFKRAALLISTVPIALLSNVSRIIVLILVTHIYGEKTAMGFVHDFTGVMVFVLGFLGFMAVSKLLRCKLIL